jgi:MazG family protein
MSETAQAVETLLGLMERLRAPDGCPWDREQTLLSLRQYLIEEAYEVIDAIEAEDPARHVEELGDLLLQVVFQAQLAKEKNQFEFKDVAEAISAKLIRRHPHVFADVQVSDSNEVLKNWEQIKAGEKKSGPRSVVEGVPRHLPALQKAHQVQSRVARVGFDWNAAQDVVDKIAEELDEVREALAEGDPDKIREEIGDLLFAVVNLSRFQKMNAEELLGETIKKFTRRFQVVEAKVHASGKKLQECSLTELEAHWVEAKREEQSRQISKPGFKASSTR